MTDDRSNARWTGALADDDVVDLLLAACLSCVALVAVALSRQPGGDWSFFVEAGRQLMSGRWATAYIDHPDAQSGPLTLVLAWALDPLGVNALRLAIVGAYVGIVAVLVRAARGVRHARWRIVIGGVALAVWWPQLGHFGHLDDALVLLLATCAVLAARGDRRWTAAVLAGLAVGVKPTAVFALAFTVPRTDARSARGPRAWLPLVLAVGVAAAVWGPVVLGDLHTLQALRPRLPFYADSVPGLFGFGGDEPSGLYRAVQLVAVVAASAWAARARGPHAVLLVGVATRLLLDPGAWPYYTPGLVLGALAWELFATTRRVPWVTVLAAIVLAPAWLVEPDGARAALRLAGCVGALAVVALRRPAAPAAS